MNKRPISEQYSEKIKNIFLFKGLESDAIEKILSEATLREFSGGQAIFDKGHDEISLGIVLSGSAEVFCDETPLNLITPGCVFGAAALFAEEKAPFTTVRAKGRTKLLLLSRRLVEKAVCENPSAALNYIKFLSGRVKFLNTSIELFTSSSSEEKVVKYFRENASCNGKVVLASSLSRLSEMLGIGRASLYRSISSLEKKGVISKLSKSEFILNK